MKKLLVVALLLPFLLTPAFAQDGDKPTQKDIILQKLEDLQKSIDGINNSLRKDVEKNKVDIKQLQVEVHNLKSEVAELKATAATKRREENAELRRQVDQLKKTVEAMRASSDRVDKALESRKPTPRVDVRREPLDRSTFTTRYNPPEFQYAKVKLVNTYHLAYTCTVNGEKYTVKEGDTVVVDYIMPGEFTYQIIGLTDVRRRTITAKETFVVNIHPQTQALTPKAYESIAPAPRTYESTDYHSWSYPSQVRYTYTPQVRYTYTPFVMYRDCGR